MHCPQHDSILPKACFHTAAPTSLRLSLHSLSHETPLAKGEAEVLIDEMDLSYDLPYDGYALAMATPRAMAAFSSSEPDSGESRMARPSATKLQPKRTAS